MIKTLLQRLKRQPQPRGVILIGTGPITYQLMLGLQASPEYRVEALIGEEPWQHRTLLEGVRIYYPSELIALCEKLNISAVINTVEEGWQADETTVNALLNTEVNYLFMEQVDGGHQPRFDQLISLLKW